MPENWFWIHHPTMSQLPVLVLLVAVIHLPAHTQLAQANSGQGCPFLPPVTSQPRPCRQKGEGDSDSTATEPRGQAQFQKAHAGSLRLQNFPRPSYYEKPSACKRAGPRERAKK